MAVDGKLVRSGDKTLLKDNSEIGFSRNHTMSVTIRSNDNVVRVEQKSTTPGDDEDQ